MPLELGIICIIVLLAIGFGVGKCFYGYKIYNFLLRAFGFCMLGGACLALGLHANIWVGVVAGLAGGVVGAYLAIPLECVLIFMGGASIGFGLTLTVLSLLGMRDMTLIVGLPFALVGGILAVKWRRPMIIICTAISGAASVALAVVIVCTVVMLGFESVSLSNWDALHLSFFMKATSFAITCVLSLFGIAFQFHNTEEAPRHAPREDYRKNTVLG